MELSARFYSRYVIENSHKYIAHIHTQQHILQIESRMYSSALATLNINLSVTTAAAGNVNLTQASYLLSAIVNGFGNQTVGPGVSEVFNNFLTLRHNNTLFMHMHLHTLNSWFYQLPVDSWKLPRTELKME